MSDKPTLIDTNLLVYAVDKSESAKQRVCKELLCECWKLERSFTVSVQNLSEFYVTVTMKTENPIPKKEAKKFVSLIVDYRNWKVIAPTAQTIKTAIALSIEHNVHYWDALIAATMQENGVFSIYTEDRNHYTQIPWLTVTNPLEKT